MARMSGEKSSEAKAPKREATVCIFLFLNIIFSALTLFYYQKPKKKSSEKKEKAAAEAPEEGPKIKRRSKKWAESVPWENTDETTQMYQIMESNDVSALERWLSADPDAAHMRLPLAQVFVFSLFYSSFFFAGHRTEGARSGGRTSSDVQKLLHFLKIIRFLSILLHAFKLTILNNSSCIYTFKVREDLEDAHGNLPGHMS